MKKIIRIFVITMACMVSMSILYDSACEAAFKYTPKTIEYKGNDVFTIVGEAVNTGNKTEQLKEVVLLCFLKVKERDKATADNALYNEVADFTKQALYIKPGKTYRISINTSTKGQKKMFEITGDYDLTLVNVMINDREAWHDTTF